MLIAIKDEKYRSIAPWVRALVLALAYAMAFYLIRPLSTDQWYLPAGLRICVLLIFARSYWPYLIAADAAALIYSRLPWAGDFGCAWLVFGSLAPMLSATSIVYLHRKRLATGSSLWIVSIAAAAAILVTLTNQACTYYLMTPQRDQVSFAVALRYIVGHYLGILMIAPVAMLYRRYGWKRVLTRRLTLNTSIAITTSALLFAAVIYSQHSDMRQGLRILMIAPAIALTFLHGWRGAVIGGAIANITIALTMHRTGVAGTYDPDVFVVQQLVAVAITALLAFGALLSRYYSSAIQAMRSLDSKKIDSLSLERMSRHTASQFHAIIADLKNINLDVVQSLKETGRNADALAVRNSLIEQMHRIQQDINLIYPIGIDKHGLFDALLTGPIPYLENSHCAEFSVRMQGNSQQLSSKLQLAAYRCICEISGALLICGHQHLRVAMRCSTNRGRRGLVVRICPIIGSDDFDLRALSLDDSKERLSVHGGILQQRQHTISFLLADQEAPPSKLKIA